MKNLLFVALALVAALAVSCGKKNDNVVVVYTTVDQVFSEPILKDFERETGIKVKAVFDAEETKSTGVVNRIIAEKDNPQCDVFWSGDPVRTIMLKQKGITQPYRSPSAEGIPAAFIDPEFHWTGFSARARVLIYNKKLLAEKDAPKSIFELTKKKYKGEVAIANPLFGTTTFHVAAIFEKMGDDLARKYFEALKNNDVVIATSNGDVKNRVMRGEVACGLTDTDDAFEAKKESDEVDYLFLDQLSGFGTLIMPNTVNLIANCKHAENGKKLIDYLLSKTTEAKLAKSCAQMPLHKGVPVPPDVPSLDAITPMTISYEKTAALLPQIQKYVKRWMAK
jgi:iron(III) transport system substrate-binding protein